MPRYRRVARVSAGVAGLMLFLAPPAFVHGRPKIAQAPAPQADAPATQRCCFANPEYAGVCVVQPGEGETCASVLAYLNNPRSQGKSYCGNTSVRGGWKQVECPKASSPAQRRK